MKREHVDKFLDNTLGSRLDSNRNQKTEKIEELTERVEGDSVDVEINEARDLVTNHKFNDAAVILRRLQSKKQHLLSKHQRYRIFSNFGAFAFGEGSPGKRGFRSFFATRLVKGVPDGK